MDKIMLNTILEKHRKWATNKEGGERANLSGADLRDANLSEADLCAADLSGADLSGANLCRTELWWANLCGANLCGANLYEANLRGADLSRVDLRGADLREANLIRTNIREANLSGANIREAKLSGANLSGAKNIPYIPMACPDTGSFVAWKKAREYIIKLFIPEDAMRLSATGRRCRANKAKVLEIQNVDGEKADISSVESDYDSSFIYVVGQEITVPDFEENRFIECASGIHFFINRQDAVNY